MMVLVTYDVSTESEGGKRRLRRVSKVCSSYGQRVQNSVFECLVDPAQWTKLWFTLQSIIDVERDSLRAYYLGANYKRRIEHIGAKATYDQEGPLII
ncbi:MAG: CRISPR-associated endonuclease Cas2 [candidate division Zixibacteria bacterium]|nr:CRISPR-associated endonuclease Cas2 [candidate division Zixibacteria bacterium]